MELLGGNGVIGGGTAKSMDVRENCAPYPPYPAVPLARREVLYLRYGPKGAPDCYLAVLFSYRGGTGRNGMARPIGVGPRAFPPKGVRGRYGGGTVVWAWWPKPSQHVLCGNVKGPLAGQVSRRTGGRPRRIWLSKKKPP